ncbi:MAG: PD-(D/E)XK nuclease family protein, partial [Gallionella sp.]
YDRIAGATSQFVIGITASHSTKLVNEQVAGYPAQAGIQQLEKSAQQTNPLAGLAPREMLNRLDSRLRGSDSVVELPLILPTGKRTTRNTAQQQRGIWLHAILQHLTSLSSPPPFVGEGVGERGLIQKVALQNRLNIPTSEIETLWQQSQHLLTSPPLARFFDAQQYRSASNEMSYVNAAGELKRIDRLVEFDDEVWVLDYKLGASEDAAKYQVQMLEYQTAMQSVYAGKTVRCALLFADGVLSEVA